MQLKGIKVSSAIIFIVGLSIFTASCSTETESQVPTSSTTEVVGEKVEPNTATDTQENVITETEVEATEAEEVVSEQDSPSEKAKDPIMPQQLPEIKFSEGSDYVTKFPNEQPKNPVLMEFFSYMCPHCFNFEPTMKRWIAQKPESVELIRIPVSFGQNGAWGVAARAYYIAEELNMIDQFSDAIFRKIHIEKRPPSTEKAIGQIFLALGVSDSAFKKAASSFNVDSKLRKAEFLTKKYKVSGVPYFLINKKYETGKNSYESEQTLFRLWNFLPAKDF